MTFNTISYGLKVVVGQLSFKPCYKWMTFNTDFMDNHKALNLDVLNLVINGWPSIPYLDLRIPKTV